ncbi:MAG: molybdenum cofactor biosynthesis protein B [Halothiobacillus sp. 24-54-40]|jgi:molybdenum cofactor biosynthesis protein B|nr:molybdenum cofactor biosynthesis protein B [Halothiobacillaceae bacterium]OYV47619.1 MAG: molybdenum cofactor biosynthesis protein B [Halothiobacillus sp. 20-53-49]OYY34670.1 MAG: molybdenum cofactor biosynthesis protein B [Halothiobacillus sp. 35-54-62]OYZ86382.1 MAG: molybdenum cofactor biosynthesis protein B [Halothiobacillus sp. 24-54-40]OZA79930.1 MAG: molybdenum cofactor biosynthesis protein B [Halothiobacillus sp. 39-53-45]HQS02660.1 molybdenum cofactor biosynthesis protein B [Haloth
MIPRAFMPLNIAVLTVSDTRSLADDRSGDALQALLTQAGHTLFDRQMVRDDTYAIRAVVSAWINEPACQVVITTGGTGLTGRDGTPEAIKPLLDKEIEGFGELFRMVSWQIIGSSTLQSRATAGVANGTYLFVLPGSTSACQDAWNHIIQKQLDYRTQPCNMVELMPRLNEQ